MFIYSKLDLELLSDHKPVSFVNTVGKETQRSIALSLVLHRTSSTRHMHGLLFQSHHMQILIALSLVLHRTSSTRHMHGLLFQSHHMQILIARLLSPTHDPTTNTLHACEGVCSKVLIM
jgi:hypothetical protein